MGYHFNNISKWVELKIRKGIERFYAIFSGKLTFLTPIRTRTFAYQGVKNVSFSEKFAKVLNKLSLMLCFDVFLSKYKENIPIDGNLIKEKTMTYTKEVSCSNFHGSAG